MFTTINHNSIVLLSCFHVGFGAFNSDITTDRHNTIPPTVSSVLNAAGVCVLCTCEHGPLLALLLHPAVFFARQRVRRLEHKVVDVVALLEVSLLLRGLLLLEVRLDKSHLYVGELGVQVFGVDLREAAIKYGCEVLKHKHRGISLIRTKSKDLLIHNEYVIQTLVKL